MYILNYVTGILAGNHEASAELASHTCHKVELDVSLQARLKSSQSSQKVMNASRGPSIDQQETDHQRNHAREQDMLSLLTAAPHDFLASGQQVDIPGWTFSEVITEQCSNCSGKGKTTCGGCGGQGSRNCSSCGMDGRNSCFSCKGSGRTSNGSQTSTCGRCGGSGRTNCSSCGGRKKITCSRCSGSGSIACTPCHATGQIHTRHTRRHYADISVQLQTLSQPPHLLGQFLTQRWNDLASVKAIAVAGHNVEHVDANGAKLRISAQTDLDDAQVKISGTSFQFSGGNGGMRPIIEPEVPFLSQLLDLPSQEATKQLDKALTALSHLRLVREAVQKAEDTGSKLEARKSAAASDLARTYGGILSEQDQSFVADLASRGLGKARGKARRAGWLKFMGECFLVTCLLMTVALWLWGLNVYGYEGDEWGSVHIWVILAATGLSTLWVFLGWRRVSRRVRDLGQSLGLDGRLKSRQGGWLLIGPLMAGGMTLLGWVTAYITFLAVSMYTGLFTPEVRDSNWIRVEDFASSLPVRETVVPQANFKLYELSDPNWGILPDELSAGTEIKVLGPTNYGRYPVLVGDEFGWVESGVVQE